MDGNWVVDEEVTFFHSFYDGMTMGPPGAGMREIDITPVVGIEDIISIKL